MGNVVVGLSMSLDGFIAGPHDSADLPLGEGGERLFRWYFSGDTDYEVPSGGMTFKVSPASAELLREAFSKIGAVVSGRRTFDFTNGWNGRHPLDVPVVVVTHTVPQEWIREHEGAPFTFVTDGVERAVARAREIAGDKDVGVAAASITQQCIEAGLLDEIHITLVPVLLGSGVRLFEHLGAGPIDLEKISVIETPEVTHLGFRVVKGAAKSDHNGRQHRERARMTAPAEELADRFEAVNDEIIAIVTGCTDAQWRQPCASEGWPVGVVAHHIAVVQGAFARMVETLAAGETFSPRSSMEEVHRSNALHARAHAAVGKPETLDALRTNGAAIAQRLRSLGDEHLDRTAGVFGGRELSVAQVVEWIVIGHAAEHLASLRATIAD